MSCKFKKTVFDTVFNFRDCLVVLTTSYKTVVIIYNYKSTYQHLFDETIKAIYIYIYIYNRIEQCALPVTTIMALWQLVNLGTRCTVTHCRIALWSHQSAQTASSERCIMQIVNVSLRDSPPNPQECSTECIWSVIYNRIEQCALLYIIESIYMYYKWHRVL